MRMTSLFSRLLCPSLLILLSNSAPSIALPSAAAESTATAAEEQVLSSQIREDNPRERLQRDLQALDRRLRLRLLQIAEASHFDAPIAEISADEVQRYRRTLRSLEDGLHALPGDFEPPEAAVMIRKIRALRPWVDNLERAMERPATAAAGLADLRRALKVEWPPVDGFQGVVNDGCADATPIGDGTFFGETTEATPDGEGCFSGSPDVWFAYTASATTNVIADTFGSGFDTVLSVYSDCPGTYDQEIACNDDTLGTQSAVGFLAQAGETYLLRVAGCCGDGGATGPFVLNVGPGGTIAGTVTDAMTNEPLDVVQVDIWNVEGFFVGADVTGPEGDYQIAGLIQGDYFAVTSASQGYLREVYDDILCDFTFGCDPLIGTPILVVAGATTDGIDFALNRGGAIAGTLTEAATGEPLADFTVRLEIYNAEGEFLTATSNDAAGEYSKTGLPAGTYHVVAESSQYRDELYDDLPCNPDIPDGCIPTTGTPIEVNFNITTRGIDFALERLGVISGRVSEAGTGFPIATTRLRIWDEVGEIVSSADVDSAGTYRAGGLDAGTYFVSTDDFEHFDELFDNFPCEPDCDPTAGTPVEVNLNSTTADIDFVLERLGAISGTVTQSKTGDPIEGAFLVVYDELGDVFYSTLSSSTGAYILEGLATGNYTVTVQDLYHQGELYDDIPCEGCDPTQGTPIGVEGSAVTGDIDFALESLGSISGRVIEPLTGLPLNFIAVSIFGPSGALEGSSETDVSGEYLVRGLRPGTYFAVAGGPQVLDELYDGLPCEGGCDPTIGTPIAVDFNTVVTGIDFSLDRLGTIEGRVSHLGQPVTDALVTIYDSSGNVQTTIPTDLTGKYNTGKNLFPGTYFAMVAHPEYDNELFNNIPCQDGCDPTTGTPIPVVLNLATLGINFLLDPPGSISGRVTQAGQPVSDAQVEIYRPSGTLVLEVETDASGDYFAGGLDRGHYFAVARHPELNDELYDNLSCQGGCDPTTGTRISVSADETTPNINFALGYCTPTATSLCLTGDRFRVEATWEDSRDGSGLAQAEGLTNDSGYFWFFSPANIELVVKVLDACTDFNHFWVFGAGLTDVGVELTITDELTGEVRPFVNPLGNTFEPITDTSAFPTCDAGRVSSASVVAASSVDARLAPFKRSITEDGAEKVTGSAGTDCVPSETGLCLNEGRFLVEALWRTRDDRTGSARAIQLTGDAGYFWFFSPDNVEVVVKLLNACELEGFNNFWVFAAGLTDVEVTLTVTDTVSGESQEYFNPLGTAFEAVTDTAAFDTCNE